ncbi:hypothetical protein RR48_00476 [Papilio machaon]|uniref:Uncharacterized protein n=1 Tax=Papilio machaon TaxID=76193 RepID=A0A0N0PFC3_PAPMA|nr:hypothetical protein RR48_00476 [Papilio machaon]
MSMGSRRFAISANSCGRLLELERLARVHGLPLGGEGWTGDDGEGGETGVGAVGGDTTPAPAHNTPKTPSTPEVVLPKREPAAMDVGDAPDLLRDMPPPDCLPPLDALGNYALCCFI